MLARLNGSSVCSPSLMHDSLEFSVRVITCILRRILVTLVLVVNEKRDVGMAKHFSKKYRNKG